MKLPEEITELVKAGDVMTLANMLLDGEGETPDAPGLTGDAARNFFQNFVGDIPEGAHVEIRHISDSPADPDNTMRCFAAHALGRIPEKESAKALIDALDDHSQEVVEAVVSALRRLAKKMNVDVSDAIGYDRKPSGLKMADARAKLPEIFGL